MSASPWTPVHHEDADEPEPQRRSNGSARPTRQEQPMAIPIGMTLQVPPELTAAVQSIAEAQAKLIDVQTDLADRMDGLETALTDLVQEMRQATAANGDSMAAGRDTMAGHREQMGTQHEARGHAHQQALADLAGRISDLQNAMLAPRRVTLERDKAGLATGAVSTTGRIH